MNFWDHLEELRKALIHPLIMVMALTIAAFLLKEPVFDIVLAANSPDFVTYQLGGIFSLNSPQDAESGAVFVQLINTELASQFLMHMKVSFYVGLILTIPFLFYKLFRFVSPGLYQRERKYSKQILFFSFIAFFIGILVSYYIVFPFSFRFLAAYQVSGEVSNMITLGSYINTLMTLSIAMGIFFELPIMSWLLSRLGVLQAAFLKKYRRHAVTIILVISAIITPTTDIFTLLLVSIPIMLLYELSIVIVKIVERGKKELPLEENNVSIP